MWEYEVKYMSLREQESQNQKLKTQLNELGKEGWEVFHLDIEWHSGGAFGGHAVAICKRRVV